MHFDNRTQRLSGWFAAWLLLCLALAGCNLPLVDQTGGTPTPVTPTPLPSASRAVQGYCDPWPTIFSSIAGVTPVAK